MPTIRPTCLCVVLCAALLLAPTRAEETADSLPRAERDGRTIAIVPKGPTFEIPAGWIEWWERFHNNLHLTREELAAAEKGGGEWDREYAEVMNATLDFTRCGFQGGDDGWGEKGCAYSDLQVRVYVIPQSVEGLAPSVDEAGARAVAEILRPTRIARRNAAEIRPTNGDEEARRADEAEKAHPPDPAKHAPERSQQGEWHRRLFRYDLFYGDYGASAHVDVRMRNYGSRALVFAFAYTNFRDQEKTIAAILDSVRWPDPPSGK